MYIFLNIPSIYEAFSKVDIFRKGYSPGPIIRYPAIDYDSIWTKKANFIQYHGNFFTVKFF